MRRGSGKERWRWNGRKRSFSKDTCECWTNGHRSAFPSSLLDPRPPFHARILVHSIPGNHSLSFPSDTLSLEKEEEKKWTEPYRSDFLQICSLKQSYKERGVKKIRMRKSREMGRGCQQRCKSYVTMRAQWANITSEGGGEVRREGLTRKLRVHAIPIDDRRGRRGKKKKKITRTRDNCSRKAIKWRSYIPSINESCGKRK